MDTGQNIVLSLSLSLWILFWYMGINYYCDTGNIYFSYFHITVLLFFHMCSNVKSVVYLNVGPCEGLLVKSNVGVATYYSNYVHYMSIGITYYKVCLRVTVSYHVYDHHK